MSKKTMENVIPETHSTFFFFKFNHICSYIVIISNISTTDSIPET